MKYYVQCPKCGSFETACNTKVNVKFKPFHDDKSVRKVNVLSTVSNISSQIKNQINNGENFEAECDTCGHRFIVEDMSW